MSMVSLPAWRAARARGESLCPRQSSLELIISLPGHSVPLRARMIKLLSAQRGSEPGRAGGGGEGWPGGAEIELGNCARGRDELGSTVSHLGTCRHLAGHDRTSPNLVEALQKCRGAAWCSWSWMRSAKAPSQQPSVLFLCARVLPQAFGYLFLLISLSFQPL